MGGLNRAFHNLSFEALCAHKGLTCSPAKGLAKCKPIGEDEKHRVCFPFAMVELKHDIAKNTDKEFCYCQAANAASCALAMLCQLCQHTPNSMYWHDEHNEVLPVVTFTFIGNEAKVWLAYVSRYRCAENEGRFIHQYVSLFQWCLPAMDATLNNTDTSKCNAYGVATFISSGKQRNCAVLSID